MRVHRVFSYLITSSTVRTPRPTLAKPDTGTEARRYTMPAGDCYSR
jgi:hypothetical protein